MNNIPDPLNRAFQLHRAGKIREAIEQYLRILPKQKDNSQLLFLLGTAQLQVGQRQQGIGHLQRALAISPRNADALNNLGNALQEAGRLDEALASFDKAVVIRPEFIDAYYNRGGVLHLLHRLDEALESYERALKLKPDHADACNNLGNVLKDLERLDEALASYDKALMIRPHYAEAHYNRGSLLKGLARLDEALSSYDRALELRPDYAEAHNNRGNVLRDLKRFDEALGSYGKALAIRPGDAELHYNHGNALKDFKRFDDALASYEAALVVRPDFAEACNNRGNALKELKRLDEALASYERAVAIRPDYADAHNNRGVALQDLGRFDEALASYDQAVTIRPDYVDAIWNKSLLLILTGHYLEGWKLYESRFGREELKGNYYNFPQLSWRGQEDIRGKRLLVHGEQGFGDVIQFCRYMPLLEQAGARLIFEVPRSLVSLVSTLKCSMTVVAKGSALPGFDAYCPVMSLPHVFKTTLETIPGRAAYLFSDPARVAQWKERLGRGTRLRVGLVWSGSEKHKNDHNRSLRLEQLLGLVSLESIEWHSLQKEYRPGDLETLGRYPQIHQHQGELQDFADTAALVECMDLVISVDTSVAHVVGALGKPLWILLPSIPDYRWLMDREDSPWYPSAKLYRQPHAGDWTSAIAAVEGDVVQFARKKVTLNTHDSLAHALQLHRSGKFPEAIEQYLKLLPQQENNARILYLLGAAYLQAGQRELAIEYLQRYLAVDSQSTDALTLLGDALRNLKRAGQALAAYDKLLSLRPDQAEVYNSRGIVLNQLKQFEQALSSYDRALALQPDHVEAHNNRGIALKNLGRLGDAIASYEKAISIRPGFATAHNNRGNALKDLQRFEEALESYDKALLLRPDHADTHNNKGVVLQALGRFEDALLSYDKALALRPDHADTHNNKGVVLLALGQSDGALLSYDRALAHRPDHADAFYNRGDVLQKRGKLEDALASYDDALAARPGHVETIWNKSLLLLLAGRYIEGWGLYEWRFTREELKGDYYDFPGKSWRGQDDIAGRRLLIHGEQGFGDIIQFCRYLPRLRSMGAEIIFEVPKPLLALVSTLRTSLTVVAKGVTLPQFDAYCPVMSLPYVFKTTLDSIPREVPYLSSDPRKVQAWRDRLGRRERTRVGIAWSGSDKHKNDRNRSIALKDLHGLLSLDSIEWHSLQKEYRPADLELLKQRPQIHQHQAELRDFSDTAALVECMDLVISVDTSVAHVAGAIGKAVWILLPFSPDFRWLMDRDDSPWYPSAKLYRQPVHGDWATPASAIRQDLLDLPDVP